MLGQGCVAPDAVQVASPDKDVIATAGPQDQQGGSGTSVQVGSVAVDGGTVAVVVVLGAGLVWFAMRSRARRRLLEWRVAKDMGRPAEWKKQMQALASRDGVESELHRTVHRLKRRSRKSRA